MNKRSHRPPRIDSRRPASMGDWVRISVGVLFVLLGVSGLVLPILQGILFLIVAAVLFAPYSVFIRRQQARLEAQFPDVAAKVREWVERMGRLFKPHG